MRPAESEGRDRQKLGLALPGMQNALVADAIASAAGRPVVALVFAAGPVDPALFDGAGAVVDCLYPAEATGATVAAVLTGAVRGPTSWTILKQNGPNHLGLW